MPRGRQFEYAPEKLSKSPAGSSRALLRSRCLRDRSIGWDGEIAGYANDWHRRIFDAIVRQYLLIEAAGIALAIFGGHWSIYDYRFTMGVGRRRAHRS